MKKLTLFLISMTFQALLFSQKQGNIWMFGQGGGLDFNSGTPTVVLGSQVGKFDLPEDFNDPLEDLKDYM